MEEAAAIKALNAISQETRVRIVRYLIGCGDEGSAAGDIGKEVGAEGSRASFHLSNLENAGVVTSERQSRKIIYRVDRKLIGQVISFLLNDCCDSHPDVVACCIGIGENCCANGVCKNGCC